MDILLDHGLKLMEQLQVGEFLLHEYFLVVGGQTETATSSTRIQQLQKFSMPGRPAGMYSDYSSN
jgi:hypothetical protein